MLIPIQGAAREAAIVPVVYVSYSSISIEEMKYAGSSTASIEIEVEVPKGTSYGSAEIIAGDGFMIMVDAIASKLAASNLR